MALVWLDRTMTRIYNPKITEHVCALVLNKNASQKKNAEKKEM